MAIKKSLNCKREKRIAFIIGAGAIIAACFLLFHNYLANDKDLAVYSNEDPIYEATLKRDILCFMLAYPDLIKNIERNPEGNFKHFYALMKQSPL